MTARWIKLDSKNLNKPTSTEIKGVRVNVLLSPYDIPNSVRGYYDKDTSKFMIEFRYITEEPSKRQRHDDYLAFHIGKNSGRLYKIEIDVDSMKANAVELTLKTISDAIQGMHPKNTQRKKNYEVARNVINSKKKDLLSPHVQ